MIVFGARATGLISCLLCNSEYRVSPSGGESGPSTKAWSETQESTWRRGAPWEELGPRFISGSGRPESGVGGCGYWREGGGTLHHLILIIY